MMASDDNNEVVSASAATRVQLEHVIALMNTPDGAAAMQTQQEALPPLTEICAAIASVVESRTRWRQEAGEVDAVGRRSGEAR